MSDDGINIVGSLSGAWGTAIAAQAVISALRAAGVPLVAYDIPHDVHERQTKSDRTIPVVQHIHELPFKRTLFLDMLPALRQMVLDEHQAFFVSHTTAIVFYWEVNTLPLQWHEYLRFFDYIFSPSHFVARVLEKNVGLKSYPIPITPFVSREKYSTSTQHPFRVIFSYDPHSGLDRKNPLGGVNAFAQAFAGRRDVELWLKVWQAGHALYSSDAFSQTHPGIRIIESDLTYQDNLQMLADADCYLSLHRGEGLGLGMLEAMALGKAVVATNYGGNTDFIDSSCAIPVPYTLIATDCYQQFFPHHPFDGKTLWAEPAIEYAATALAKLADDPDFRTTLGNNAQRRYQDRRDTFLSLEWLQPFLAIPSHTRSRQNVHLRNPETALS